MACMPALSAQQWLWWLTHVLTTLLLLPAAAAQLDDVLVVGYGEWESRKALESHLQKGAIKLLSLQPSASPCLQPPQ